MDKGKKRDAPAPHGGRGLAITNPPCSAVSLRQLSYVWVMLRGVTRVGVTGN